MSFKHHDVRLLLLSLVVLSALVALAFLIARSRLLPSKALRNALHVAVGAWTLFVTPLFDKLGWAVVLPAAFIAVNAAPQARPLFRAIAETPERAQGLWTFPAGVLLAYVLFWEPGSRPAILAGLVALTFADPIASIVGRRWGQRKYRWFGHGRTVEGSLAFFLVAAIGAGVVASTTGHAWRMGVGCGFVGMVAEAVTPSGWDNLIIPVSVAAAYHFLA